MLFTRFSNVNKMPQKSASAILKQKMVSASELLSNKNSSGSKSLDASGLHCTQHLESAVASISISQSKTKKQTNSVHSNQTFSTNDVLDQSADLRKRNFIEKDLGKQERFNPFDENTESLESDSSAESSRHSSESQETSLAELGLAENHFSYNEGHLGLSSQEELNTAIENCKEMILKLPEGSKKKKKLVESLVNLRIKLEDAKDKPTDVSSHIKSILGHRLEKTKKGSLTSLCDCCSNSIWGLVQVWFKCKECSYQCHEKCINNIRRPCVARLAKTALYELSICPESGLSKQDYRCAECRSLIANGSDGGLLCDYTGLYYCNNCHWSDTMIIPARVVHNWDHEPRQVCRRSYQLLTKMRHRPILNLSLINPKLFKHVEELSDVQRMREDILKMKQYLITCNAASEAKILLKLSEWPHFVDGAHLYSMKDLEDIYSRTLTNNLTKVHIAFGRHIKLDCLVCQAKGFICERCHTGETLFPFDLTVSICPQCAAVFHRDCFSFLSKKCPRCKRKETKRKRAMSHLSDEETQDELWEYDDEPVAYSSWLNSHKKDDSKLLLRNSASHPDFVLRQVVAAPNSTVEGFNVTSSVLSSALAKEDTSKTNPFSGIEEHTYSSVAEAQTSNKFLDIEKVGYDGYHGYHYSLRASKDTLPVNTLNQVGSVSNREELNPFVDEDDVYNPFREGLNATKVLASNKSHIKNESSYNPFEEEDLYDNNKNPFCCN